MRLKIFLYIVLGLILSSCVENTLQPQEVDTNGKEGLVIEFGGSSFTDVQVTTKGTLPSKVENRVVNMYVFVFDNTGDCIYSQYYDNTSRVESATLPADMKFCWYADERDPSAGTGLTNGKIKLNSANFPTDVNGIIYIISNLDTELSTISAARLDLIHSEEELSQLVNVYKQSTSSRLGNFLMVGKGAIRVRNGNITNLVCGHGNNCGESGVIHLERIDSKVEFKIGIVPGAKTLVTADFGEGTAQYYQVIESFTLNSWQVYNLPNGCYLLPHPNDASPALTNGYFTSNLHSVETIKPNVSITGFAPNDFSNLTTPNYPTSRTEYGFSFYMYENRRNHKKSVNDNSDYPGIDLYHLRDKRLRNADGTYAAEDGDMWEYAPEKGTYVEIKGEVKMKHYLTNGELDKFHIVYSDVVYYIHLGDFGSSTSTDPNRLNDYKVDRNTHYTYTVDIMGVNSIAVESQRDMQGYSKTNEIQSGAKGDLYAAPLSNNYTFDAHYGQRVFELKYTDFSIFEDPSQLSWYVSTPFGRKGMPDRVGENQVEVPNGLDYKWVRFHINTGPNRNYNYPWPGNNSSETMDVLEFSNYMRDQVTKKRSGQANDFDLYGDETIYVTAYVDEFYYESDPITAEVRPALWKEFVNKPSRIMNIICTSAVSAPGTSSYYKSIVSIRQESIKSIYGNAATEGWGVEAFDEMYGKMKFLNRTDTYAIEAGRTINVTTTDMNGLYNSGKLWGLVNNSNSFVNNIQWSNYINLAKPNAAEGHTNFLLDNNEISTMRYSCLMRNRDENGDGVIQKEEIKWYLASMGQLRQLFIGELGLMGQARLYYTANPDNTSVDGLNGDWYYPWRSHVISSTLSGGRPQQLWAEEGCATGSLGDEWGKNSIQSIRCVRNLDEDVQGVKEMTNPDSYPEDPIKVIPNAEDGTYTFDLSRMNPESLRIKTNTELVPLDENSQSARPYLKFETGSTCSLGALSRYDNLGYVELYDKLMKGYSVCPSGYRVPNIREMAIAFNYIPTDDDFWDDTYALMCCNYYSFGDRFFGGNGYDGDSVDDWSAGSAYNRGCCTWYFKKTSEAQIVSVGYSINGPRDGYPVTRGLIRCVRDVD